MIDLEKIIRAKQAEQQVLRAPQVSGHSWSVKQVRIDLGAINRSTFTAINGLTGAKVYYQKSGSHRPGGLVINLGGELADFTPGSKLVLPFTKFSYRLSAASSSHGIAQLLVFADASHDFQEPDTVPVPSPVELGSGAITENVQPAFLGGDSWVINGWRRLRVLVDGGAANTLTSCTLIPWFLVTEPAGAIPYEQGIAYIDIPDSRATGYRYRVFEMELTPMLPTLAAFAKNSNAPIEMSFEIRDLLPAGATQLTFTVYGVE